MLVFLLACADPNPPKAAGLTDPAESSSPDTAAPDTAAPDSGAPDSGTASACGGAAPHIDSTFADAQVFQTEGGVHLDENGVVHPQLSTTLAWVALGASVTDDDGDLQDWALQAWIEPDDGTEVDTSAPPLGVELGEVIAPACGVYGALVQAIVSIGDDGLQWDTDYVAALAVADAAGETSAPVSLSFRTPAAP